MNLKKIFPSIFLASVWMVQLRGSSPTALEAPSADNAPSPRPYQIDLRYKGGRGIGYNHGYGTLEVFFAPSKPFSDKWLPFIDVRGHLFNNHYFAANAGAGLRYLSSYIWGFNAFYDYRHTSRSSYKQISVGLESLGSRIDFRLNSYLPIGKAHSSFFHPKFEYFKGHTMWLSRKREFALTHLNAEIGWHLNQNPRNALFYLAGGPYYLFGESKHSWGGQVRTKMDFFKYLHLEGIASYDNLFQWRGQGSIGLTIAFGGRKEDKSKEHLKSSTESILMHRLYQHVDRDEIIPIDTRRKMSRAINPASGKPYVFWFVDNTSHSLGTFESPFPTLLEAQNASSAYDVIYVFGGDGTSQGMNAGITLQDYQWFLGAAIPHVLPTTLGEFVISPLSSVMPNMTNSPGSNGIELASHNLVSGFQIAYPGGDVAAIHGDNITDTTILNNVITGINNINRNGNGGIGFGNKETELTTLNGNILIANNTLVGVNQVETGISIDVSTSFAMSNIVINNNYFSQTSLPVFFSSIGSAFFDLTISNNVFEKANENPVFITCVENPTTIANITNNLFNNGMGQQIVISNYSSANTIANITNNVFNNANANEIFMSSYSSANTIANITNNVFNNANAEEIVILSYSSANTIANITNNVFNNANAEEIVIIPQEDSNMIVNIKNNIISNSQTNLCIDLLSYNNSTLTATVENNNITISPSAIPDNTLLALRPQNSSNATLTVSGNTMDGAALSEGIYIAPDTGASCTVNILNNQLYNNAGYGINFVPANTTQPLNFTVMGNSFVNTGKESLIMPCQQPTLGNISNNTISQTGIGSQSMLIQTTSANANLCLKFLNNQADQAFDLTNSAGTFNLEASSLTTNTPSPTLTGNINIVPNSTCQ